MSDGTPGAPCPYRPVAVEPAWPTQEEAMGTKLKFWCQPAGEDDPWLFKYPRQGSGEYDIQKTHGQSDHSLANIFRVLETVFVDPRAVEIAKRESGGYLVLDALIGDTDRHHQNWGLVIKRTPRGMHGFLAPTFDHASSLGRELNDETRARRLRERTVGQYAERARGRVFWSGSPRYGPNPSELVRLANGDYPTLFRQSLRRVQDRRTAFAEVVNRVPDDWMSPIAKDFTAALLDYNANQLEQCLK